MRYCYEVGTQVASFLHEYFSFQVGRALEYLNLTARSMRLIFSKDDTSMSVRVVSFSNGGYHNIRISGDDLTALFGGILIS